MSEKLSNKVLKDIAHDGCVDREEAVAMATELLEARARIAKLENDLKAVSPAAFALRDELKSLRFEYWSQKAECKEWAESYAKLDNALRWLVALVNQYQCRHTWRQARQILIAIGYTLQKLEEE
jgi:outer membrane murein-binding lipoprotein Lpp